MASQPTDSIKHVSPVSFDTALCLIPPGHIWKGVDRVRYFYDKGFEKWPPHINLIYPFVQPEALPGVASLLSDLDVSSHDDAQVQLSVVDTFSHKHHQTIFLRPDDESGATFFRQLVKPIHDILHTDEPGEFQPHMTIGQSDGTESNTAPHNFLLEKAQLLAPITWSYSRLALLVREPKSETSTRPRRMMLWGLIDLKTHEVLQETSPKDLYAEFGPYHEPQVTLTYTAYQFSQPECLWRESSPSTPSHTPAAQGQLIVASYNVLAEFSWPPLPSRYPALIDNILCNRAAADILVLQEVTDHFLSFLLSDNDVCSRYPYSSHGPPQQPGVGPLGSFLNIVVLSKYRFNWTYLPFHRKHKGSQIVTFPTLKLGEATESERLPLILATCHLSRGLVDEAVNVKKNELQKLLSYLGTHFSNHPWVIAGDFNLATSSYSLVQAREKKDLSPQGYRNIEEINATLRNAGLQDAWLCSRVEVGESSGIETHYDLAAELYEGEQGATFDPLNNTLAACSVDSGYNKRPQRYDKILVSNHLQLRPSGFNTFGRPATEDPGQDASCYASDHWGIRCLLLNRPARNEKIRNNAAGVIAQHIDVQLQKAPPTLGGTEEIHKCLANRGCWPTEADAEARQDALQILEQALQGADGVDYVSESRYVLDLVIVPVGSFGLGTWTTWSDMDCLCIGTISSSTFFTLASRRLRKAADKGISISRRVKAATGTMLELKIRGIKFDLQYCAARSVLERWPDVMKRPNSDPAFALPFQVLAKLKPARDMYYLQRSIPDMKQYRVAHMLIKSWAMTRGLFAARFGLLGGIQIAAMLVPICKRLAFDGDIITSADIVTSFFRYYAGFEWSKQIVYDHFFHGELKYHRGFREPMCLLGWHAPSLNTATNASGPTARLISAELSRASRLLSKNDVTWDMFLGQEEQSGRAIASNAALEFLKSYPNYIKIEIHYWGRPATKLNKFLGWLESRFVSVLVEIDKRLPLLTARIWPGRFLLEDLSIQTGDSVITEYHGCYLVGLDWQRVPNIQHKSSGTTEYNDVSLESILQTFEGRIRGNDKYYDANICWMSATIAEVSELASLRVDEEQWKHGGIYGYSNGESDDEDELDSDEEKEEDEERSLPTRPTAKPTLAQRGSKQNVIAPSRHTNVPGIGKFRTAADVMSRLRWDSDMDVSNYVVGYEDRFSGAREKALEDWKSEQTDEEFIPQHRILYFKRRSDGVIVWERRTRTDDIFGSGVSGKP